MIPFYPRSCRRWYDTGRKNAIKDNASLHVTAPYQFAHESIIAQSATSPLMDPRTGEHVGQVLLDFSSDSIFEALDKENIELSNGGFPILIAVQGDEKENTVTGPGFLFGDAPREISELVLPQDYICNTQECDENLDGFADIVESMKKGEAGTTKFTRTTSDGGAETVHISYAPVIVKSIRPLNSSDFASGIEGSEYLIYSLGLCETEKTLLEPFEEIKEDVTKQINVGIVILSIGIVVAILFIVYVSYIVTASITEPMLYLLELIRCINR
jgi:hypothetical protein